VTWSLEIFYAPECSNTDFVGKLSSTGFFTPDAGNAKDVNAAIHVIDPWPRYSGNRRIPGNGARMTGAIQRYRSGTSQNGRPADSQFGQPTPGGPSAAGNLSQTSAPQ